MQQDPKEVASRQKTEMQYICKVFFDSAGKHLTLPVLKQVMLSLGKNGKMNRSRAMIYAALRSKGFIFVKPKRIR